MSLYQGQSIVNELELELAEYLVKTIPCAEMVRFAKNGQAGV